MVFGGIKALNNYGIYASAPAASMIGHKILQVISVEMFMWTSQVI